MSTNSFSSSLRNQSALDAGDAFNHFWKAMERLDHLSQPVAFATASLGLGAVPHASPADSAGKGSDTEDDHRSQHKSKKEKGAGGNGESLPMENSFSTAYDGELVKSRKIKQSLVDLTNDFDEIAEEGAFLPRRV
jgi:hypothetical protein